MISLGAVSETGKAFELPDDFITQVGAVIARRGWGKTYAATGLAEQLMAIGGQLIAIDPVGVWWGITINPERKQGAPEAIVFGGEHAHAAITEHQGAAVAELVIESGVSAVIDVSLFTKNAMKRFVADFVERLYHQAKTHRRARMLFLEEAQVFAPERTMPGDERMLGAIQSWVRLGRNYSCGCLLVTQRPQSVSKEVLNQAELLILGQLVGPHERKAIQGWVVEQASEREKDARAWLLELPSLPRGVAWVWSPSWLGRFEKVVIRKKTTLDTSATLKLGDQAKLPTKPPAPTALADLVKRLEELTEAPAAAKTTGKRGKGKLELVHSMTPAPVIALADLKAELEQTKARLLERTESLAGRDHTLDYIAQNLREAASAVMDWLNVLRELQQVAQGTGHAEGKRVRKPEPRPLKGLIFNEGLRAMAEQATGPALRAVKPAERNTAAAAAVDLPERALVMLEQLRAVYPLALSRTQLATAASMVSRGGTFSGYLRALNERHLLSKNASGSLQVSDAGWKLLGVEPVRRAAGTSRDKLIEFWRGVLKPRDREVFDLVIAQPGVITRDNLAKGLGMASRGGTFSSRLRELNKSGLVVRASGGYRLAPLFDQTPVVRI